MLVCEEEFNMGVSIYISQITISSFATFSVISTRKNVFTILQRQNINKNSENYLSQKRKKIIKK